MARRKIWRSWRSVILATAGGGTIRRRGSDVLRLISALVTVIAYLAILLAGGHFENAVLGFLAPPPSGVK